jgi:hypothetical protein
MITLTFLTISLHWEQARSSGSGFAGRGETSFTVSGGAGYTGRGETGCTGGSLAAVNWASLVGVKVASLGASR